MEIDIKNPHDSFFKNIFGDINNTRDFLKAYLPKELSQNINFDKIKISDTEKENLKYKKLFLDLSVECEIANTKSKIYIIFEHKSYKDKMTLIQILNYCLVFWEKELQLGKKNLTPIIPLIFYHGKNKTGFLEDFRDYFKVEEWLKKYLLSYKMVIFDTTKIEDEEIMKNINNLFLASAILLMKNHYKDIDKLKPILKTIVELEDDRAILLFEYFATNQEITEEKLDEVLTKLKGDKMPSLAEVLLKKGKMEGIIEGEKQGFIKGKLEEIYKSVKMGLEFKFQKMDEKLFLFITKIKDINKLEEIQKAIFTTNDIEEFRKIVEKISSAK